MLDIRVARNDGLVREVLIHAHCFDFYQFLNHKNWNSRVSGSYLNIQWNCLQNQLTKHTIIWFYIEIIYQFFSFHSSFPLTVDRHWNFEMKNIQIRFEFFALVINFANNFMQRFFKSSVWTNQSQTSPFHFASNSFLTLNYYEPDGLNGIRLNFAYLYK